MSLRRCSQPQAGFSLIEVLVTALIVAILATTVATALISTAHASGQERQRATADSLAAQDQERMRGLSDEQLAQLGGSGQTRTVTGTVFTVNSSTSAVDATGASSCTGQGAADFRIISTVTWTATGGTAPEQVQEGSLIARPATGNLEALVKDQTGSPVPGVAVSAIDSGGQTDQTSVTDSNGCNLFAGLATGQYTLGFTKAGYIDQTGDETPTLGPVPVNETGNPVVNTLSYAPEATVTATLKTNWALNPAADADRLGWLSPKPTTPAPATGTGTGGSSVSAKLYPFTVGVATPPTYTGNYSLWAGPCVQQNPPTTATPAVLATAGPGATVAATVTEPALYIKSVKTGALGTTPVAPTAFTFTFASRSGTTCSDKWTTAAAAGSGTTAPASGWLQHPGQPYADGTTGALTACVTYKSGTVTKYATATTADYGSSIIPAVLKNTDFSTSPIAVTLLATTAATSC